MSNTSARPRDAASGFCHEAETELTNLAHEFHLLTKRIWQPHDLNDANFFLFARVASGECPERREKLSRSICDGRYQVSITGHVVQTHETDSEQALAPTQVREL